MVGIGIHWWALFHDSGTPCPGLCPLALTKPLTAALVSSKFMPLWILVLFLFFSILITIHLVMENIYGSMYMACHVGYRIATPVWTYICWDPKQVHVPKNTD